MFKLVLLTFLAMSGGKVSGSSWTLELTVCSTDPSAESITLTFGWADGATSGFDSGMDLPAPPSPPSGGFYAYFSTSGLFPKLYNDIRVIGDTTSWRLKIEGTGATISWDKEKVAEIASANGIRLLLDGIDMKDVESYSLNSPGEIDITVQSGTLGLIGDFDGNGRVNFDDFFLFVDHFGLSSRDPSFEPAYDLDGNGRVDFDDFFIFVDNFGNVFRQK